MTRMIPAAIAAICLAGFAAAAKAELVERTVAYKHAGEALEGFLVYDDAETSNPGRAKARPGVLVVHEWWGLNDFARNQARQLARLGYVAFAADMYGQGKVTDSPQQASAWAGRFRGGEDGTSLMRERASAGLAVLAGQPEVDAERLAAIGFCFGGTTVLQLAFGGANLKGVASFHGNLPTPTADDLARTQAAILVLHGAADPHVSDAAIEGFTDALAASSVDWQMVWFGGAVHAFTNTGADAHGLDGVGYDAKADGRSHAYLAVFLRELLDRE